MNVARLGAQWVLGMSVRVSKSLQVKPNNEQCRDCGKEMTALSNLAKLRHCGSKAHSV